MEPGSKPAVLLVEDSSALARVYMEYLRLEPCSVTPVETGKAALDKLDRETFNAVLLDLKLPDMDGMDILRLIVSRKLPTAVIIISAHGTIDTAVDALRNGARDFLEKPFNAERLVVTLRNVLEHQRLARLIGSYADMQRAEYCGFIGSSLAMQVVYRMIDSAAPSDAPVFVTGESGTGKELCAEAIHRKSRRAKGPFIALNCGAIPRDLMESELFGHVKGAFTGAVGTREGAASLASGGTLFLDEIGELPLDMQVKLLRFVQTRTFQKVGSNEVEKVDVRIVSATNRDPLQEVEAGRFREDLYYRLHVIPVHLPPLRDRQDDLVEIAVRFLEQFSLEESKAFERFTPDAIDLLQRYNWPGNVRELQNVIRQAVVMGAGSEVSADMLPPQLQAGAPDRRKNVVGKQAWADIEIDQPARRDNAVLPLWAVEKEAVEQAIAACNGNIPRAAALLEVSPSTIYRKRQAWEQGGQE